MEGVREIDSELDSDVKSSVIGVLYPLLTKGTEVEQAQVSKEVVGSDA